MGGFLDKTKGHDDSVRTKGRGRSGGVTARARPSRSKDERYKHGPRKCTQGSAGARSTVRGTRPHELPVPSGSATRTKLKRRLRKRRRKLFWMHDCCSKGASQRREEGRSEPTQPNSLMLEITPWSTQCTVRGNHCAICGPSEIWEPR